MKLNFTAIYTIWLREMKRFARAKSRVFGAVAMPLFFLLFLGMGFKAAFNFSGLPPGIDYVDFLAPGIIGMALLFESIMSGMSVLWDRQFGFLKEIMVAPVNRVSIVLGKTAGGMTTALIQGIIILLIAVGIGFKVKGIFGVLLSIVFMVLIATSFVSLGLIFTSIMRDMQGFQLIMRLLTFPLFILSGAFFPLERLPIWLKSLSYINPLTYGVDGMRYCLIGMTEFSLALDLFVLVCFCTFMICLSTYFFGSVEVD
nr:putative daunorubicin resistance ABC transporter, permease protein [uncultured archaeon]